jgi:aspartate kinase
MTILVQKFGGTSLAEPAAILRCAARAVAAFRKGRQVVVVVSAMGHTTDKLLELARQVTERPSQRELDALLATGEQVSAALMSMAIHKLGVDAVGLSGPRLGIITDPVHNRARIRQIDVERIRTQLASDRIVVAAGFQGVTPEGEITTLGRGGSDTTAVALAAALGVKATGGLCEIYTDVDGVYTADPRVVPDARRLDRISYEEMLELASLGAGVMHTRAVIFGSKYDVPIRVLSSLRPLEADGPTGTMIVNESPEMESVSVVGCALTPGLGRVTVRGLPHRPGTEATIFRHIAGAHIMVDDIMQIQSGEETDVSFTVGPTDLEDIRPVVEGALAELECDARMHMELGLAKVSAVGVGMRSHTGVAARMFAALEEAGVNIANITTSEIKISCIVPDADGPKALRAVHDAFGLAAPVEVAAGAGRRGV